MVIILIYWSPHFTEEEGCCLFPALIFFERVESIIIGHIDNIAILGSVWNRIWDIYGLPRSDSRGKFNNKCQLLLPGVLYTDHTVRSERRRVPGIKWILHTERKKKQELNRFSGPSFILQFLPLNSRWVKLSGLMEANSASVGDEMLWCLGYVHRSKSLWADIKIKSNMTKKLYQWRFLCEEES